MLITYSKNNVPVRLTQERWGHILRRHPEMEDQQPKIVETVAVPDFILEGDFGELLAVRHYLKTPLTKKYLIVAYKETSSLDGFVMTAYFTNEPSERRKTLWKP